MFKPLNLMAFLLRGARLDISMRKSRASRRIDGGEGSTFAYRRSAKTAARGPGRLRKASNFSCNFNEFRRGAAIAS
jgi:hypothetical protein